jgi:hypothetical protein
MRKHGTTTESARPLKGYALKEANRKAGTHVPFEFKDRPALLADPPPRKQSVPAVAPQVPSTQPAPAEWTGVVRAKVTVPAMDKGFLFLKTEDGLTIYMGANVLQRSYKGDDIRRGFIIECEIRPHHNGKGPQGVRVLSVTPPST